MKACFTLRRAARRRAARRRAGRPPGRPFRPPPLRFPSLHLSSFQGASPKKYLLRKQRRKEEENVHMVDEFTT